MEEILKAILNSPEGASALITELVKQYKPVAYAVLSELFGVYKDWANNQDYFETEAKFTWNRFKALTDCGFTQDQAMSILLKEDKRFEQAIAKNTTTLAKSTEKISKTK